MTVPPTPPSAWTRWIENPSCVKEAMKTTAVWVGGPQEDPVGSLASIGIGTCLVSEGYERIHLLNKCRI